MLSKLVFRVTFEGPGATKSSLCLDEETLAIDGVEMLVERETLWSGSGADVSGLVGSISIECN